MSHEHPDKKPYKVSAEFPNGLLLLGFSFDPVVRNEWRESGFVSGIALFRDGFHYSDAFGRRFSTADKREIYHTDRIMGYQSVTDPRYKQALENISIHEARGDEVPGSTVDAFNYMSLGKFASSEYQRYLPNYEKDEL